MDYLEKANLVKTYAVIAYIAKNIVQEKTNMYNVLKAIYLADKEHMENYGRFILNEDYEAWKKGPVPLKSYHVIKTAQRQEKAPDYIDSPFSMSGNYVGSEHAGDIDLDLFSISDLECLDKVINSAKENDLGEAAHDDAWHQCFVKGAHHTPMDTLTILGTLKNATALIELHQNPHP